MEKPRRVLIFSLAYNPFIGGAEVAVKEITDRLGPLGYQFDMVTPHFDRNLPSFEKIGSVAVHRVGIFKKDKPTAHDLVSFPLKIEKFLFPLFSFWKASDLHRENHFSASWAIMANQAGAGALFFKYIFPKVPLILTLQEGDPDIHIRKKVGIFFRLWRQIFLKADSIQVISNYLKEWALSFGYKNKISVIPNGVDIKRFTEDYSDVELEDLKTKFSKKNGDIFLITTSRLVHKNAVDISIRSLNFLPDNIKLLIAGDGPLKRELESLVERDALSGRVKFLGEISQIDLPKYLKISDVFVRPSRSEGLGNSFIEAFASGIPIVATSVGGIKDFLYDKDVDPDIPPTGLICKVDEPEGVASCVKKLLSDEDLKINIINNAKDLVRQRYDWDKISERMSDEVFSPILNR